MRFPVFVLLAGVVCCPARPGALEPNEAFSRLVGPEIAMDRAVVERVLSAEPGKKFFSDTDGDGRIDAMYFIDTDERHGGLRQPLLVKVVDEDGDMCRSREGDTDSDLYVADWYADGSVDRVVDYVDLDGDGDVDEQYLYQWTDREDLKRRMPEHFPGKSYFVVWAKDYGDDDRLWYHINYEYGQTMTQWKTDFNGDEMFVYFFSYDYETGTLTPVWENAFSFYDLDGDTYSEEAVRFTGTGAVFEDMRYSMDIDNDTTGENRHDYDFSLSCIGPVRFPPDVYRVVSIRGHETEPIMKWEEMRSAAKAASWKKIHLTWDENDNNIDPLPGRMHHERWEGVISHGNEYVRQVGGPSCGPYNKRNEVDGDASGGMRLYHSPVDGRLHLYGAETGWIEVDYDFDGAVDMVVRMNDFDGDGFFDSWRYDIDGDGVFERSVLVDEDESELFPLEYSVLHEEYTKMLREALELDRKLIGVVKSALRRLEPRFVTDEIEDYFDRGLEKYGTDFNLGEKIKRSPEGRRYYLDLVKERYWYRLTRTGIGESASFPELERAFDSGRLREVVSVLEELVSK